MINNYNKQIELIDVYKFNKPINIIGCGAIGSWVAMMLLKMGFKNINVYDFDIIEEHNVANQLFSETDIANLKVEAMECWYLSNFNNDTDRLKVHEQKVTKQDVRKMSGVIICAVDSMEARKNLYKGFTISREGELWIEGRLSIYGGYIYTMNKDDKSSDKYCETFYSDEEAEVSACGVSQTALPAAINIASVMVMQMIEWFNEIGTEEKDYYKEIKYSIPFLDTCNSNM